MTSAATARTRNDSLGITAPVPVWTTRIAVGLLPLIELRIPGLTLADVFITIGFCAWLASPHVSHRAKDQVGSWLILGSILAAVLLVVSQYNATNGLESAGNALKVAFAAVVLPTTIWLSVTEGRDGAALIWAFCAGVALAALSAVIGVGQPPQLAGGVVRLAGLAGHPVGLSISAGIALAMSLFLPAPTTRTAIAKTIIATLAATGMFVAVGATGAVIAATGILVATMLRSTNLAALIRATTTLVFLGFLTVLVASWVGPELFDKLVSSFSNREVAVLADGSLSGSTLAIRLLTWEQSFQRIREHPFMGNGADAAGQDAIGDVDTHNFLLLAWQTLGLSGLLVASGVTLVGVGSLLVLFKCRRFCDVSAAVSAGVTANLLGAMTSPALYGRSLYFLITLGVAVAYTARQRAREDESTTCSITGSRTGRTGMPRRC